MAGKTIPWWQRAFRFVLKGIRAVVRLDPKGEAAADEPAANELEANHSPRIEPEEEKPLTEDSPKAISNPAPEIEPVMQPPAEIAEKIPAVETADAIEPETAAIEPEASQAKPAEMPAEAPEPQPAVDEPPAAAEVAEAEATPAAIEPAPQAAAEPESPAIEAAEEAFETPKPAADPEPAHEPSGDQTPLPGQAIEETIVTPEIETEATAKEPDLDAAPEVLAEEEASESAFAGESTEELPAEEEIVEELSVEAAPPQPEPAEAQAELAPAQPEAEPAETPAAAPTQPDSPALPPEAAAAPPQVAPRVVHEAIKRSDGPDTSPVSVLVSQVYEGPFDLLLDLIRKQDLDIYDIPIAKITAQFLAYVNQLKASDMDVAGEFIYTASLLIHIKSKMLLPREPSGQGDEQEDPRRELVERLLEHERFKNAAQMLQQKQMLEAATWTNPGMKDFRDDAGAEPEIAADTDDLVRIFRVILDRARNRPVLNLEEDAVTVGQMIQFLGRRLTMEDKPVALRRILAHTKSERALIAMFLALLELVRLQAILLRQDRHFSEIFIKKSTGFDAVMNQGMARDDWQ